MLPSIFSIDPQNEQETDLDYETRMKSQGMFYCSRSSTLIWCYKISPDLKQFFCS